jgi:hypothetical protein
VCPKNPANFNVDNVRVAKLLGGGLHNSAVVPGMVLRTDAVGSIKHTEKAKVRSLYTLSYWRELIPSYDLMIACTVVLEFVENLRERKGSIVNRIVLMDLMILLSFRCV